MEDRYQEIEFYELQLHKILKQHPNTPINRFSVSAPSILGAPIHITLSAPSNNGDLNGSDYYHGGKSIIHFTNLEKALSITNEGSLRLYNLLNSNDPNEFTYPAELVKQLYLAQGHSSEQLDKNIISIKENLYTFSTITPDELSDAMHWKSYGNMALEFEIVNDVSVWRSFHLAKVMYGDTKPLELLVKDLMSFLKENPVIRFDLNIEQLLSFYKTKTYNDRSWEDEKEIRILFFPERDGTNDVFRNHLYKIHKPGVSYLKIPLCNHEGSFVNPADLRELPERAINGLPRIKLSKIHLGPNFPMKQFEFQREYKTYFFEKLRCSVEIVSHQGELSSIG